MGYLGFAGIKIDVIFSKQLTDIICGLPLKVTNFIDLV